MNIVDFWVESKEINIRLLENKFKDIMVTKSITQKENVSIEKKTRPIYLEIKPLLEKRNQLIKKRKEKKERGEDYKVISIQIDSIIQEWENKLEKIKKIRLNFAKENTTSYLSVYWLKFYRGRLPLDTLKFFYDKLEPKIRYSFYGKKVKNYIDIKTSSKRTEENNTAYNFKLKDLNDNPISIEKYKGKYILLDFWASWCAACRKSNPKLIQLYNTYREKGLEIISLSSDYSRENWIEAIKKDGISIWKHSYTGSQKIMINTQYNVKFLPTYVLIDKKGEIIEHYSSAKSLSNLEKKLEELFTN